jgi:hypothetical protein
VEGSEDLVVYICEPRADAPREGRLDDADVVRLRDEASTEGVVHCEGLQQYISKLMNYFWVDILGQVYTHGAESMRGGEVVVARFAEIVDQFG